jgi:branched-chain amino acid transport system substrate-binding protein
MKFLKSYLVGPLTLIILVVCLSVTLGCSTTLTATTPPASQTVNTGPTITSPEQPQTLKIGAVFNLGTDIGLDGQKGIELLVNDDNKNGGIDIGGQKYKVELVVYDSQGTQTTETAAINRLIFEDKVKYILAQGNFEGGWLSITEANKVIVMSADQMAAVDVAPTTRYSFLPTFQNVEAPAKVGWLCENYPDLVNNTLIVAVDNQFGHLVSGLMTGQFSAFGATVKTEYFPGNTTDFSAVGTRVTSLKPGVVIVLSGSSTTDGLCYKDIRNSGYQGMFFTTTNNPVDVWLQVAPAQVLEGFVSGMYVTETEPAITATAEQFKQLWIAKYGKWTNPLTLFTSEYACIKAGLIKAGSTDTDKVSDAIASGLTYLTPTGDGKMISRPDLGNNRTVDSVSDYYLKKIQGGKAQLIATISVDQAIKYFDKANAAAPPMGPPPGGAPPQ